MKIFKKAILLLLVANSLVAAAQDLKPITVEDIYGGSFRTERIDALESLANGKEYIILNFNQEERSTSIDSYSYKTQEQTGTILNSKDIDMPFFSSYEFSADESKIILAGQLKPIFRRSAIGEYKVYDRNTKELIDVSTAPVRSPSLSPAGDKIAYVQDNNIYLQDLGSDADPIQVTGDGRENEIINGVTDWVYEEEFSIVKAYEWNADGTKLAYIRFDERDVPEFSMDMYGSDLYQYQHVFKYPKAGEDNALVSLHIYDLNTGVSTPVDLKRTEEFYIPRIKWTKDANTLTAQVMNRHQNELDMYKINGTTAQASIFYQEKDAAYIDIKDDLMFLKDGTWIWTSEKSGYNHIYHMNADGSVKKQVTSGNWEVTNLYGVDTKKKMVYYQSVEEGSTLRDIYSIKLNGKKKRKLSKRKGTHSADFSADFSYYINTFSNSTTAPQFTLHSSKKGKLIKRLKDNKAAEANLATYQTAPKEYSTININGNELNMYMIKPANFDPNKKYPLYLHQYSGPGSQQVADRWVGSNDYYHMMLANDLDIIVASVDGRGTGLKGAAFKKVTQNELGKYEVEDQIAFAKALSQRPYIDADRIGIWGWSYGGFMSSNCLMQGADTFSMAIAVAPVTSWRFYDTIYTERYMTTPQENASGYDNNSPVSHVDKLKGKFLLVHGSADDNVHVQNSMVLIEALIQANKQFDWKIYPDKNHGIYGGNTRIHLFNLMKDYIKENL